MTLCYFCVGMFSLPFTTYDSVYHNWTRQKASLDHNCQLCRLIYTRICDPKTLQRPVSARKSRDYVKSYEIEFWISRSYPNILRLELQGLELLSGGIYLENTGVLSLQLASTATWGHEATILGTVTSSLSSFQRAMSWLKKCTANHAHCVALGKAQRNWAARPKRLVQAKLISGKLEARLCSLTDIDEAVVYMTLSHCWGTSYVASLTRKTHGTYMHSINTENIPRVFRDAMFIAAKAGIEYIWIDSLCIMQDSAEDWVEESIKMGDIYRHSVCNIAATGFADGSSGLFVDRDATQIWPMKCYLSQPLFMDGVPVQGPGEIYLIDRDAWKIEIENGPLNTRAWVVQERLLSPRTLHFGASQIWWECCELVACEVYPEGLPSQMSVRRAKMDSHFLSQDISDRGGVKKQLAGLLWNRILEKFAGAQLTVPSDRLVSIAGLAKILAPHMKCRYLAGLWEDNLIHQLLWTCPGSCGLAGFDLDHTDSAPSWSWASSSGTFTPHRSFNDRDDAGSFELTAQILSANVTPKYNDAFVHAEEGCIRIRGCLSVLVRFEYRYNWKASIDFPATELDLTMFSPDKFVMLDYVRAGSAFDFRRSDVYFLLPLKIEFGYLSGLIMQPVIGRPGTYKRVGVLCCDDQHSKEAIMRSTRNIPPEYYIDWDGWQRFTVTLI